MNGTVLMLKTISHWGYETATEELPLLLSVKGEGPRFAGDVLSPVGEGWVLGDCPTGFPAASELTSVSASC